MLRHYADILERTCHFTPQAEDRAALCARARQAVQAAEQHESGEPEAELARQMALAYENARRDGEDPFVACARVARNAWRANQCAVMESDQAAADFGRVAT